MGVESGGRNPMTRLDVVGGTVGFLCWVLLACEGSDVASLGVDWIAR